MPNLPFSPVPVTSVNPIVSIFYGATKIGKTAALAELKNNLIIDLEKGADSYECLRIQANEYSDFREIISELSTLDEIPYKYVTIDTVDRLVEWFEVETVAEWNKAQDKIEPDKRVFVTVYSEIPWGKGYDLVRLKMRKLLHFLRGFCPHVILVAHLKRTIIGETTIEVKEDNLDLVGKLRNMICADADAVGYFYRGIKILNEGEENEERHPALKVSFKASENTAAGSRRSHLKGKSLILSYSLDDEYITDWTQIYPE